ncbi:hypothetical protein M8C21_029550, partial [Ambrosia artemisiifolia]
NQLPNRHVRHKKQLSNGGASAGHLILMLQPPKRPPLALASANLYAKDVYVRFVEERLNVDDVIDFSHLLSKARGEEVSAKLFPI